MISTETKLQEVVTKLDAFCLAHAEAVSNEKLAEVYILRMEMIPLFEEMFALRKQLSQEIQFRASQQLTLKLQ